MRPIRTATQKDVGVWWWRALLVLCQMLRMSYRHAPKRDLWSLVKSQNETMIIIDQLVLSSYAFCTGRDREPSTSLYRRGNLSQTISLIINSCVQSTSVLRSTSYVWPREQDQEFKTSLRFRSAIAKVSCIWYKAIGLKRKIWFLINDAR